MTDVYGMKMDKEFVNTLEDNIRKRGAMDKLISDQAQSEVSNWVKDILRALFINHQSRGVGADCRVVMCNRGAACRGGNERQSTVVVVFEWRRCFFVSQQQQHFLAPLRAQLKFTE